jgi:oligogalacturonide lyase
MKISMNLAFSFILLPLIAIVAVAQQSLSPREWVDPNTGHKIIRISDEPGSQSLYFHYNAYTATGDKMVYTSRTGLYVYDFGSGKSEKIIEGRVGDVVVGPKTRQVYYIKDGTVYGADLDTKKTRSIVTEPRLRTGSGFALNSTETVLGGSYTEGEVPKTVQAPAANLPPNAPRDNYEGKGDMMERRLAAKIPMALYTLDIKTGEVKAFYHSTDWLNHVQFSPTDPTLMMFCHEGPWHKVDRIWTIRTDGSDLKKIHTRTMDMEIAGHEFFSHDGRYIYYDLQTPKGKEFWLAGVEVATGKPVRYAVPRSEWSVHYNVSPNGKFFSGDGGGPRSVAAPGNGQWLYLFTPDGAKFRTEKLVDLSKHDYGLEPNATFTPDGKWLVFRSNMVGGDSQVYAVQIKKS